MEKAGFDYIRDAFLNKDVSSLVGGQSFAQQAQLKDLAFLMTLLRVFLKAGFQSQSGGIGRAITLSRKSSSIQDNTEETKDGAEEEDRLVALMKSPEGQQVIIETDFEQLFTKVLSTLGAVLTSPSMILEEKLIVENSLSIILGCLLYKKELWNKFTSFRGAAGSVADTEGLILEGLLCSEEKVRIDTETTFGLLAVNLNSNDENALYMLLGILARNFANISNRPSRQFFELFNRLIDLKARRDDFLGQAADDSSEIYNPEDLLNQIIDKIKTQQKLQKEAGDGAAEGEDEVKALEEAAEQERLLVGLISLTGKIIAKADKAVSDRIITEKDLIGQIFREFLFASYF